MRKAARLSSNAPEVFELECGPLPCRRRRLADDETLPEMYEIAENESTKNPWVCFDGRIEAVDSDDPMFDETMSETSEDDTMRHRQGFRRRGQPHAHTVSCDMVHCGGNLRRLVYFGGCVL